MRLSATRRGATVCALGLAQTIAWGSSYYLPAVLAYPMARDLGVTPVWVFAAFSGAMILSAVVGPWGGAWIDRSGGKGVLVGSNLLFASALILLATAHNLPAFATGWAVMGIAMGIGLYDAAFSALAAIYGREARTAITGITLIAGFASTIGWPLSALVESEYGWRTACVSWAALHLLVALPLNSLLPKGTQTQSAMRPDQPHRPAARPQRRNLVLLSYVFAVTWFTSTAMAVHLPQLLQASGASSVAAIAAAALIGPSQVAARMMEFLFLRRISPVTSARLATLAHPLGASALLLIGAPAAAVFTPLHGAGNGILTIAKGTLPLALFGPGGYGLRQGMISAPARILQAFAPILFGIALDRFGANALWLTAGLGLSACLALFHVRSEATDQIPAYQL